MRNCIFLMVFALAAIITKKADASAVEEFAVNGSIAQADETYTQESTQEIITLVKDAATLIRTKGEMAFNDFRVPGSRWRKGETYIFVLDTKGNMLVHPDATMEGKNELDLKDINGKPIIRGLLATAMTFPTKPEGWYHYQWPVPGGLVPRWKSSYVQMTQAPSGKKYIVGCGDYNDRMEREFVVDMVNNAVAQIQQSTTAAYDLFRNPSGPFLAKDSYLFVFDPKGICLFNAAFPNLEGHNLYDQKDTRGKFFIREMLKVTKENGRGWVDYMWPKPGEAVPTLKSAYVNKVKKGNSWVMVGCGVYLADAPKAVTKVAKMSAEDLMALVRDAAVVFEREGEKAFPEFRVEGSKWFRDDTYFFVWTMDGIRYFHAANPAGEGADMKGFVDAVGRPMGQMLLDAGASPLGEGWVHYMYPEPGEMFPVWKSAFVKRVTFPSGKRYIIGCGVYNMQMDKPFIEDVVNRAATLVAEEGKAAFAKLRDKRGAFAFMDTYVFVLSPEGVELVNGAMPALEGKNIINLKDLQGKTVIRDEIAAAMTEGSAWMEYYWYQPGDNTMALKETFVRKVQHKGETYIIGSGFYGGQGPVTELGKNDVQKLSWNTVETEWLNDKLSRQVISGEKGTLAMLTAMAGGTAARHYHASEEYSWVISGTLKFIFDDREVVASAGEIVVISPNVPHTVVAMEDNTVFVDFFAPVREDWLKGEDQYLRIVE